MPGKRNSPDLAAEVAQLREEVRRLQELLCRGQSSTINLVINDPAGVYVSGHAGGPMAAVQNQLGQNLSDVEKEILVVIQEANGPMTGEEIASAIPRPFDATLRTALAAMRRRGALLNTFPRGYSLPQSP